MATQSQLHSARKMKAAEVETIAVGVKRAGLRILHEAILQRNRYRKDP